MSADRRAQMTADLRASAQPSAVISVLKNMCEISSSHFATLPLGH